MKLLKMIDRVAFRREIIFFWVFYQAVGHVAELFTWLSRIKKSYPNSNVTIIVSKYQYQIAKTILDADPRIKEIIVFNADYLDGHQKILQAMDSIDPVLKKNWDILVAREPAFRWDKFEVLKELKKRAKYNKLIEYWPQPQDKLDATILLSHEAQNSAEKILQEHKRNGDKLVCLVPGSAEKGKTPSIAYWEQLLEKLCEEYTVLVIGLSKNKRSGTRRLTNTVITQWTQKFGRKMVNLVNIPLDIQIAAIKESDAFVSSITGMAFFCDLVKTPTVIIEAGPFPNGNQFKNIVLNTKMGCSPCWTGRTKGTSKKWQECRKSDYYECVKEKNLPSHAKVVSAINKLIQVK